jgi:D-alanyl-D-alanine carboxypeptidase
VRIEPVRDGGGGTLAGSSWGFDDGTAVDNRIWARAAARGAALALVVVAIVGDVAWAGRAAATPAGAAMDPALAQRIDTAIDRAVEQAGAPGAIVGIWGPQGAHVRAVGVADKVTAAPMEPAFHHRIGSLTKTFTVTGVLQLADQGLLRLDDPIARYIPGVPEGDRITLRQLARMQSGLANYTASEEFVRTLLGDPLRSFTPQELLGFAFAQPMSFAPGERFEYSNTNTVLLGLVVEKVSGQALPDYIRDWVTTPLGMRDTVFPLDNSYPTPHAHGYTEQSADGEEADATDWNPAWAWAAGAMISTLDDLRIWAPALATGRLLTPGMQQERLQLVGAPGMPAQDGYGLGLFSLGGWIGHNGSLPGYQTVAIHLPERDTTVVIEINTDVAVDGSEPSTILATAITEVLTPDHVYSLGA